MHHPRKSINVISIPALTLVCIGSLFVSLLEAFKCLSPRRICCPESSCTRFGSGFPCSLAVDKPSRRLSKQQCSLIIDKIASSQGCKKDGKSDGDFRRTDEVSLVVKWKHEVSVSPLEVANVAEVQVDVLADDIVPDHHIGLRKYTGLNRSWFNRHFVPGFLQRSYD